MAQKFDPIPTNILKYNGIFDYDGFLKVLKAWLTDHGYEFHENSVKYKVPSPSGAEIEMEWKSWRKVTGHFRYWIDIAFHLWDVKEVEVIKDGKKRKMTQARMQVNFAGRLENDFQNRYTGRLGVALQDFLYKYVWKFEIDNVYSDELYYRVYKIFSVGKQFLDMEASHNAAELRW